MSTESMSMRDYAHAMGGILIGLRLLGRQEGIEHARKERTTSAPIPAVESPYLTAKEAAEYLRISYSTFRKRATRISRAPGTNRYRRDDLDAYANALRPRRKR